MFLFYTPWKRVKKENIGLKWVDNSGRGIIIIQNNAALIYGINRQNTNSIRASNNIVINGVTIFISEKFKGSCEWYFKSDIAGFQFDNTNIIKIKTFIDKIRNLTTFFIFFSFSFKSLMASSIDGRKTWRVWKIYFWHRFIDWWQIINTFFPVFPPNNHKDSDLDVSWWQNYEDQQKRHSFHVTSRVIGWHFVYYFHFTLSSGILNICFVRLPALFAAW